MKELNRYFDHTALKPETTGKDIVKLCREAKEYQFYAVCVNSCYVPLAREELKESGVKIAAVVGFPFGASVKEAKAFETAIACDLGACEIDTVISLGAMKEGRYDDVLEDMKAVVEAASQRGAVVKVILETGLLTDEEIVKGCHLAKEAEAAFVKTSTGFIVGGATIDHVRLMKDATGDRLHVKASGGIRTLEEALSMIEAGASRIGASASATIMEEYLKR